eukprot:GHVT01048547.1.p3 GENE.GHVT01048547.1~~GHVT01048547.1.p3  ORF type:complete len:105 (-),score=25.68 GHVT01048547.1:64-378(-)
MKAMEKMFETKEESEPAQEMKETEEKSGTLKEDKELYGRKAVTMCAWLNLFRTGGEEDPATAALLDDLYSESDNEDGTDGEEEPNKAALGNALNIKSDNKDGAI